MYGHKPNPSGRKRGRPSNFSKFLDRQRDLFPVELAVSVHAPHLVPGASASARSDEGARTESGAIGRLQAVRHHPDGSTGDQGSGY